MTRQFVLPGLNRSVANADQLTQPCLHHEECAIGTAAWVWPQVMNATPWGRQPRYLIHDRDAVYGPDFGAKPAGLGIAGIRTPIRALRANSVAERVVRTYARNAWTTWSC